MFTTKGGYSRTPEDPKVAAALLRVVRMRMKTYHLARTADGPVFMTVDLLSKHFGSGCFNGHEIQHIDHAFGQICNEWAPHTLSFIDDDLWGLHSADAPLFFGEGAPLTGDTMAVWKWSEGDAYPNTVVLHFENEDDAVLARLLLDRNYV